MGIPRELLDYKQWVLWRRVTAGSTMTKVPISPWDGRKASCNRPHTWSTYRHARYALARTECDGIGFVFTKNDPFCGIDLDHCLTATGTPTHEAARIMERLDSFSERSPSGAGVHILIKAKLPTGRRRTVGIEMYDAGRYFTVTGDHIRGTPLVIHERQTVVMQLVSELFPVSKWLPAPAFISNVNVSDQELLEKARRARNGERFARLWAGDLSDYQGDHSRADAALCGMLAFWTRGDVERMDRLFRRSSLMRTKWDRQTGTSTYGALTLCRALEFHLSTELTRAGGPRCVLRGAV